jgi:hypothetical protein
MADKEKKYVTTKRMKLNGKFKESGKVITGLSEKELQSLARKGLAKIIEVA